MTEETTSEQLAEIEGQATEYTPPDGWRQLAVGEKLREGDERVQTDESRYATRQVGRAVQAHERYIRPIEPQPQPQPQPEPEPEPVQVREGRWRTRGGEVKNIRPCEPLKGAYYVWPWTDGFLTFQDNGLHQGSKESDHDLVEYLGPIEPDKTQELPDKTQELPAEYTPPDGWRVVRLGEQLLSGDVWVNEDGTEQRSNILQWDASAVSGGRCIRRIGPQPEPVPESAAIEELRSEVSYVQRLLGESRQRVTQLEELVASLRTINRGCENAVRDAGKENFALQNKLAAVKAELASVAADRYRLQIELDAAQQVPPAIADRFHEGWNQGTARAIERVLEWLEPVRLVDSAYLANATMQHLPHIMRSLTGLEDEEIE